MKCPFRKIVLYDYAELNNNTVSLDSEAEEFMDCYENECPMWQWSLEKGYYCAQCQFAEDEDHGDD